MWIWPITASAALCRVNRTLRRWVSVVKRVPITMMMFVVLLSLEQIDCHRWGHA
jgi:hypothetical protein